MDFINEMLDAEVVEVICPKCGVMTRTDSLGHDEYRCIECGTEFTCKRSQNMREHKSFKFELKEVDTETGIFEGYGSTFGGEPDSYGDVVDKGAFSKTISEGSKRIKILWNHQTLEPIGKPVELREDEHGLYIKGKLSLGVQRAREVLSLMKDGVINELSIGYDTITEAVEGKVRHLKEVRLWDVSPVSFAANPAATITAVKKIETLTSEAPKNEPPKDTQEEAALMKLAELQSIAKGFDTIKADRRVEELLKKLQEVKI